jgi:hypothetical protein
MGLLKCPAPTSSPSSLRLSVRIVLTVSRVRVRVWLCAVSMEMGRAFEGWYDGVARQIEVMKLLARAAAIWKNKEMMARFNMWCWFCQDCAEAREQELIERAAERQRRREAWLLKQLFKGVSDEFEGMDTDGPDAEADELNRRAEAEISEDEEEEEEEEEKDEEKNEAKGERVFRASPADAATLRRAVADAPGEEERV